jgi:hypothetical protein
MKVNQREVVEYLHRKRHKPKLIHEYLVGTLEVEAVTNSAVTCELREPRCRRNTQGFLFRNLRPTAMIVMRLFSARFKNIRFLPSERFHDEHTSLVQVCTDTLPNRSGMLSAIYTGFRIPCQPSRRQNGWRCLEASDTCSKASAIDLGQILLH